MAIRLSEKQFDEAERVSRLQLTQELDHFLSEAFVNVSAQDRRLRIAHLLKDCEGLDITSEYAITAYCFLSFLGEKPLARDEAFLVSHKNYSSEYKDPNQLPIDLYELLEPGLS